MNESPTPPKPPLPTESPKTTAAGYLIVVFMFVVLGGIVHFTAEPISPQPSTTAATETNNRRADTPVGDNGRPPLSATTQPKAHIHSLPAWMAKLDPEAAKAPATLDKRYSLSARQQMFIQFTQEQSAVQTEIHLDYESLPPASAEENVRRSAEEGQKIVDAQGHVYDTIREEYRLTEDQMGALIQEGRDNRWDQDATAP